MGLPEQVGKLFNGVEGNQGNFHKNGIPVRHGAVPEPGMFKGFEVFTIFCFMRDKDSLMINIFR